MEIEIVGFYKNIDGKFKGLGTLHVYLVEYGIDIRGIRVLKKDPNGFFYKLPGKTTIDEDSKQQVWYPFVAFSDVVKTQDMIQSIKQKGDEFLKKELSLIKKSDKYSLK